MNSVGAVDVHYDDQGFAKAALVVSGDITLSVPKGEGTTETAQAAAYEPGALYKRELPCIRAVLALGPPLDLLIIDGYATLDPEGRPGLGAHAAAEFGLPVIGIAKTKFRTAVHAVPVLHGTKARRPLYVTSTGGLKTPLAAELVSEMAGPHRIPTAIARADLLARGRAEPIGWPTSTRATHLSH